MRRLGTALAVFLLPTLPGIALAVTGIALVSGNPSTRSPVLGWVLLVLAGACGALALRLARPLFDTLSDVVFGHRDPDSKDVTWVPGGGGHGGSGGQVPPYVPYSADHDPTRRRRPRRREDD